MLYDKVKAIAEQKKIPISRIEKDCELQQGSIGHWNKSKPSYDKLVSVAKYLGVTVEQIVE